MNIKEAEVRWKTMQVQAQQFASKEQFVDALARLRYLKRSIQDFIILCHEPVADRSRAESLLRVTQGIEDEIRTCYEAWNASIVAQRLATIENADNEMNQPLPKP